MVTFAGVEKYKIKGTHLASDCGRSRARQYSPFEVQTRASSLKHDIKKKHRGWSWCCRLFRRMPNDPLEFGRATCEHDTAYDPCRYQFSRGASRDRLGKVVLLTTRHWRRPHCGCKRRTSRRSVVESAGILPEELGW